VQESEY